MEYMRGIEDLRYREGAAVTLGKFDGLHRGHQKLLNRILEKKEYKSVMFTINSRKSGFLLDTAEKRKFLEQQGLACLIECPFVPEISGMEAETFVKKVLVDRLGAKYIAVGSDFRFGHNRLGDAKLLQELQVKYGFQAEVIEKETYCGREISSTYVKEALEAGKMELAGELLGYPFFVSGEVRYGRQLGRQLGIPTANLVPAAEKMLPPNGVYFSRTAVDGSIYTGVTNIGYKPTVGSETCGVETHLFDFSGDLYGKKIKTELWKYQRPEMKFSSVDALKAQMEADLSSGKEYFGD